MNKNYQELKFYNMNKYEFIVSSDSNFIIVKMNLQFGSFDAIVSEVNSLLKANYLEQPGVYFLKLQDGYYIGETKDLKTRLKNHIENREVRSITIATHKSPVDALEKGEVRDLESLLMEYARNSGLTIGGLLDNKKEENRKVINSVSAMRNEISATYLWDGIRKLNISDLWEDLTTNSVPQKQLELQFDNLPQISKDVERINNRKKYITNPNLINSEEMITTANVRNHEVDYNLEIFKYVPYRRDVTKGYNSQKIEIFSKKYQFECLFMYLFERKGNGSIDREMTDNLKVTRNRGWVTAATLAYYRIETNGNARGTLSGLPVDQARTLIEELIKKSA